MQLQVISFYNFAYLVKLSMDNTLEEKMENRCELCGQAYLCEKCLTPPPQTYKIKTAHDMGCINLVETSTEKQLNIKQDITVDLKNNILK